jgi:hypothetical protein
MTKFVVFQTGNRTLAEVTEKSGPLTFAIDETARLGFAVDGHSPGSAYNVFIGDELLEIEPRETRTGLDWDIDAYLDGCWGITPLRLESIPPTDTKLATALVRPSKLSQDSYERMFSDIQRISIGLLLELVSRSRTGFRKDFASAPQIGILSAQLELATLLEFWTKFSYTLGEIVESPATMIRTERLRRLPTGKDRLDSIALREIAKFGRSAYMKSRSAITLPIQSSVVSKDTSENRTIASFLALLQRRIESCAQRAAREKRSLESSLSDYENDPEIYRFLENRDSSRYAVLEASLLQTDELRREILRARQSFGVPSSAAIQMPQDFQFETTIFRNNASYARAAMQMQRYLRRGGLVTDTGDDAAGKPIWRIFEQWTFFQIVAALSRAGFRCVSHHSIFEPISRDRFTVDLERNSTLTFQIDQSYRVSLRYEPTILPQKAARGHDTVFRGTEGKTAWQPDILIEVLREKNGVFELVYAGIVDAKYRLGKREDVLKDIVKYQQIRSIATNEQIVRQIWAAVPEEAGLDPEDETIIWSDRGDVSAGPRDFITGFIGLPPGSNEALEVENTLDSFIAGLLSIARLLN